MAGLCAAFELVADTSENIPLHNDRQRPIAGLAIQGC